MWRILFALLWLGPGAFLRPAGVTAKEARYCGAGATLRLSSPVSSQGTLLLVELKSARPLDGSQRRLGAAGASLSGRRMAAKPCMQVYWASIWKRRPAGMS